MKETIWLIFIFPFYVLWLEVTNVNSFGTEEYFNIDERTAVTTTKIQ